MAQADAAGFDPRLAWPLAAFLAVLFVLPLLLLAGTDDTTVNPRNTLSLAARVNAAGGAAEADLVPGVGHIGIVTAFAPLFRHRAAVLDRVWMFVQRHGAVAGP